MYTFKFCSEICARYRLATPSEFGGGVSRYETGDPRPWECGAPYASSGATIGSSRSAASVSRTVRARRS